MAKQEEILEKQNRLYRGICAILNETEQLELDIHQVLIKYLNDEIDLFSATNVIEEIYDKAGYKLVEPLI